MDFIYEYVTGIIKTYYHKQIIEITHIQANIYNAVHYPFEMYNTAKEDMLFVFFGETLSPILFPSKHIGIQYVPTIQTATIEPQ